MSRRLMLRNESGGGFVPYPAEPWTLLSTVGSNGNVLINQTYAKNSALAQLQALPQGTTFLRTGDNTDSGGHVLNMVVSEFKAGTPGSNTLLRRTFLQKGVEYTTGANCVQVYVHFAFQSSTGLTMTQAIIDQYFGLQYKVVT